MRLTICRLSEWGRGGGLQFADCRNGEGEAAYRERMGEGTYIRVSEWVRRRGDAGRPEPYVAGNAVGAEVGGERAAGDSQTRPMPEPRRTIE